MAACWHRAYEQLVQRAAHEVNNALNAVAMNLEVARLRAIPGADAGRVAPFATAAAAAHDELIAMVRPLMALARGALPADAPGARADVREIAAQVVALLAPGVRARGGSLVLSAADTAVRTVAPVAAVRTAVAVVLAAATVAPAVTVECIVAAHPTPTLSLAPPRPVDLDPAVVRACERAGIRLAAESVAQTVVFPSA
ncbi:MAG TPA: hypothetical protein VGD56_07545 [Gemmatirosa sp.]